MNILFVFLNLWFSGDGMSHQSQELERSMAKGAVIYEDFCMNCHLPNGEGVPEVYPPLAASDYLMEKRQESIKAVKYGMTGEIVVNGKTYHNAMAALGLTDDEVADVMNYILNSWGNKAEKIVMASEVSKIEPQ